MKTTDPVLFAPTRPYKNFEPVMGVWSLRNTVNGKRLIGASLHTAAAINKLVFTLRLGNHRDRILQQEWREHGEAAFVTEVLHVLDRHEGRSEDDDARELKDLERLWLDELQPYGDAGYHPSTSRA
ncbi:GIY-YIG nuclease family protein [Deinococcus yavapaiensis]|uniref:GIY-YIG nuclease family protein n=1 Tax=Deinococcus yavapaiensis KR-236 TaxID=694435 RepID=A0A318S9X6_9DEIO|nr:GIY-YIG nuclease family protein [Deinococcus yavapaiensis]PYE53882.1 hypothetical protein DES52_107140 [Deinococcus yavapaiensis KR-236]